VPSSKSELIQKFHRDIRAKAATGNQLGPLGRFRLSCIANMVQTPLPFSFTNGPTYESKGTSTGRKFRLRQKNSVLFNSRYLVMGSLVSNL